MSQAEIVGYIVIGLGTIVGLFFAIGRPIINLNNTMTTLDVKLDHVRGTDERQDSRLDAHSDRIDKVEDKSINHDGRIISLEKWKEQKEKGE